MLDNYRWVIYALLGAFFASVVQVTSKPAVDRLGGDPVNLIRAAVMLVFFIGVVTVEHLLARGGNNGLAIDATRPSTGPAASWMSDGLWRPIAFALGSGVAASLSWMFGYKALKLSAVSKSYPIDKLSVAFGVILAVIFLGERPSMTNWIGIGVMLAGAYLVTLKPAT